MAMSISDNRPEAPPLPAAFTLRITVAPEDAGTACELIAARAGLAKSRVKDAMVKGAVWLTGRRGGRKRLRKATAQPEPGDILELSYDARLLAVKPPMARCLHDGGHYSIWLKPAGLLAQGTDYGDHCSLVRQVEVHFRLKRPVLPVHRLDREAAGLMILAHTKAAAAKLSKLLQDNAIDKQYRITVLGRPSPEQGVIELPLDHKPALTRYTLTSYDPASDTSVWSRSPSRPDACIRSAATLPCSAIPSSAIRSTGSGTRTAPAWSLSPIGLPFAAPSPGRRCVSAWKPRLRRLFLRRGAEVFAQGSRAAHEPHLPLDMPGPFADVAGGPGGI